MEKEKMIQLIEKAKSGNRKAIEELLCQAHTPVSYQCRKMLPNAQDAEDLTQEILLTVYRKLDTLQEPAAFWGWLSRITATRCMNALSRTHVDLQFAEDEDGNSVLDTLETLDERQIPDKAIDNAETARMIDEIVSGLPEAQRMTTLLYYYDEMSVKEISRIMAVPENTVKGRLNLARKAIKEKVQAYEKQGVKLYGVSVLPLLWYFLRSAAQSEADAAAAVVCCANVMSGSAAATGTAATGAAVAAAAGSASTAAKVGLIARIVALPWVIKATAILTVAALVIACIGGAVALANGQEMPAADESTTLSTEAAEATTAEPLETKSCETEPDEAEPDETKPAETEPDETEPDETEPAETEPAETEPAETEPAETEPAETEPAETEPAETEPAETEPAETEPAETEPAETEPAETEPAETEPAETEPAVTVNYVSEGCTYILTDGTQLQPGEAMPAACSDGDQYITEAYTYMYGHEYNYGEIFDENGNFRGVGFDFFDTDIEGWSVIAKDKSLSAYPSLLSEINGAPLLSMQYTFYSCESLTQSPTIPGSVRNLSNTFGHCGKLTAAPAIPEGVTNMAYTFSDCFNLTTAPVLPGTVTGLSGTFWACSLLTDAPQIPYGVTSMYGTFFGCSSLTAAPEIPAGATSLDSTFSGCTSLTAAPAIPAGVISMDHTFENCTALTAAPVIPSGVTHMGGTFSGCTALTAAPEIPASVSNMYRTFAGCTMLSTAPAIPGSVTSLEETFSGCTALTVAPAIPASVTTMQAAFKNCTALISAPAIPASVTNLYAAFSGCVSLTGTVEINASLNDGYVQCYLSSCTKCFNGGYSCPTCPDCALYSYCFTGTQQAITLTGTCEKLAELAATAENGNVTVQ